MNSARLLIECRHLPNLFAHVLRTAQSRLTPVFKVGNQTKLQLLAGTLVGEKVSSEMDQFVLEGIFRLVIFQTLWRMLVILFHTTLANLKQCAGFAFGDHLNFCLLKSFAVLKFASIDNITVGKSIFCASRDDLSCWSSQSKPDSYRNVLH